MYVILGSLFIVVTGNKVQVFCFCFQSPHLRKVSRNRSHDAVE